MLQNNLIYKLNLININFYNFNNFILCNYLQNNYLFYFNQNTVIQKNAFNFVFLQKHFLNAFVRNLRTKVITFFNGIFFELVLDGSGLIFFKWKNHLLIDFGFSHYVYIPVSEKVLFKIFKNKIILYGFDQNLIYFYINLLLSLKKYNQYKRKGLRKINEFKILKIGKKR